MVRVLGLLVALAALMAPANAALLGKYEFTGGSLAATSVDTAFAAGGGSFGSFNSAGSLSGSGANNRYEFTAPSTASGALNGSSTNPYIGFSVSNTGLGYTISRLTVTVRQLTPSSDTDNGAIRAYYRLGAGPWLNYGNAVGYSPTATSTLLTTLDLSVPDATNIEFAFRVRNDLGADQTLFVDDVTLEGYMVPEPASMAIFGSLAAFGLVRRYRRK